MKSNERFKNYINQEQVSSQQIIKDKYDKNASNLLQNQKIQSPKAIQSPKNMNKY